MIAAVWSSPNTDGLTAASKNQIIHGLTSEGKTVEEIHLNKLTLEHCRACGRGFGVCKTKGCCVIDDDFSKIYSKLVDAEGIVWISAVYWHDLTECMKAFIDRLRRCETAHNGFLAGKLNLIVACAGGKGLGVISCLDQLETSLSHMKMITVDRLPIIQFNKQYMLPALAEAGKAFAQNVAINS